MALSKIDTAGIASNVLSYSNISGQLPQPLFIRPIATNNLWTGITHGANNGNAYGFFYSDVDIASYVTSNTVGLIMRLYYAHNGQADHGYLGGYVIQKNETDAYPARADFYAAHYDDYYNTDTDTFLCRWNPSGNTNIRFYVNSSHNSNTNNAYSIRLSGTIERAS